MIFFFFAFGLFIYMFYEMIRKNDTSYVVILIIQALGIACNFIEVLFDIKANAFVVILKYILAILIPGAIIILTKKNIPLMEVENVALANFWLMLGNRKMAKQCLINLVTKYPENYQGHKMLAVIYEKEGGMRKAIDEYVQAIDINKKDYDSYYKVAELLTQLDKKDEAAQMLFNLLQKKPEYYQATILLGDILIEKELYKEAANVYQDALRFNPGSFDLNYNLGIVYTMLNDFQSAKICYEKAAELNAMSYVSKYSLAEIALIYKDLEEAEKYFMEVLQDDALSADGYYELAKIELIKGNKDMAIKYVNTAIDADSKRIVAKVKKDPIFIPIIAKIAIPFNLEEKEGAKKLAEKEVRVKEHLEEMFEITRHLSYSDIELLNYNKERDFDKVHGVEEEYRNFDERQK